MKLNAIYSTFNGEVNRYGIGSPCIFLRLQGCHIRCYKRTLGILCDTPEALNKPKTSTEINSIFAEVDQARHDTGLRLVTLTGGDPLWNDEAELRALFTGLIDRGYTVSVETSGTLSWLPYNNISPNISWVLDYKLKSAGVKNSEKLFTDTIHLESLREIDIIKFVVYDVNDFLQMRDAIRELHGKTKAQLAVGCYWGGLIEPFELFEMLKTEKLLDKIVFNMQTHKMAVSSDYKKEIPKKI